MIYNDKVIKREFYGPLKKSSCGIFRGDAPDRTHIQSGVVLSHKD